MPQGMKNTDRDNEKSTPNIKGTLESHKKLFGTGATVSGGVRITPQFGPSYDEQAWAARPRAADAGKDINLPAARETRKVSGTFGYTTKDGGLMRRSGTATVSRPKGASPSKKR